jgi:hypothetical protein
LGVFALEPVTSVMTRKLSEIDRIYASLEATLSPIEKLKYCVNLIENTDLYLNNNRQVLTEKMRLESRELIEAAQNEILHALEHKMKFSSPYRKKIDG